MGGPYADTGLGARLDLGGLGPEVPLDGLLYGEDGARAVVSGGVLLLWLLAVGVALGALIALG